MHEISSSTFLMRLIILSFQPLTYTWWTWATSQKIAIDKLVTSPPESNVSFAVNALILTQLDSLMRGRLLSDLKLGHGVIRPVLRS